MVFLVWIVGFKVNRWEFLFECIFEFISWYNLGVYMYILYLWEGGMGVDINVGLDYLYCVMVFIDWMWWYWGLLGKVRINNLIYFFLIFRCWKIVLGFLCIYWLLCLSLVSIIWIFFFCWEFLWSVWMMGLRLVL